MALEVIATFATLVLRNQAVFIAADVGKLVMVQEDGKRYRINAPGSGTDIYGPLDAEAVS